MKSKSSIALFSIALAVVLFVCVNILSDMLFRNARIDLTQSKAYTLSEGTKTILEGIEEPITLKFFYSQDLASNYPQLRVYGDRVRDLLFEYASRAGSGINLEIINPTPFTDEEDEAVSLGISAVPTDTGDNLYFGLVGENTIDGQEVIPFFTNDREAFLEYDLTELIYKLVRTDKPVLGLLSALPLDVGTGGMMAAMQGQSQPYVIYDQLVASFDLEILDAEIQVIDEDIKVLMVVHPAELSQQALYAIDQFVLRGGRALVFVDPLSETASQLANPIMSGMPQTGPVIPISSDLGELFSAWGVDYNSASVVGDLNRALRVQTGADPSRPFSDYVVWMRLGGEDMAPDDLVSAQINTMHVPTSGYFTALEDAETKFSPLIQTTDYSKTYSVREIEDAFDPDLLVRNFEASPDRYALAARVSGQVKSAFPEGPPEKEEVEDPETEGSDAIADQAPEVELPPHLEASTEEVNLILVADTDLLDDKFWVQEQNFLGQRMIVPTADNGVFVINAVESLMGSNELISLRSRTRDDRPLEEIELLRQRAEAEFLREQERLEAQLVETETRLSELKSRGGGEDTSMIMLSPEEEAAIADFQDQLISTRKELRGVQRSLRADVEALETRIRLVNMVMMPALVAMVAIGIASVRRRRRARMKGAA